MNQQYSNYLSKLGEGEGIKKTFPPFHPAHHTGSRYEIIIRFGLATSQWLVHSLILQVHNTETFSAGRKQLLPQGSWTQSKIKAHADYTQPNHGLCRLYTAKWSFNKTFYKWDIRSQKGVATSIQSTCLAGKGGCFCGKVHVLYPVRAQLWWQRIWGNVVLFLGYFVWFSVL